MDPSAKGRFTVCATTADNRGAAGPHCVPPTAIRQLAARLEGQVLSDGDAGYDSARRVFNAMIDRRPALIVRCAGTVDVIEAVGFARENHLRLSVKGGGHNVAGTAVCEGGLMLDLSHMKGATVDPVRRIAAVQPGLTLGELDRETQTFGLATPTGVVSMTGVSGLALGGGLGWLNGKYGLTCDNLLAADLVTASGELITAGPEGNRELLWGLRGGGGNLGIVTALTFRLHPVGQVLAGAFTYPARKARAALRLYHEFASECPDELGANASLSNSPEGEVVVSIGVCCLGPLADGDRLLGPLRALGPDREAIEPMPYPELQRIPDEGFPSGQQHYWKSGFLTELSDELIDVMLDFVARMPSQSSGVGLQQLHGVAGRVQDTATAFPHRGHRYDCLILSQWPDPADSPQNIAWTRELFDAISPFFATGVYVNNLGEEGEERVRQAYGRNYERLLALKTKYDPTNLFQHNQNIRPLKALVDVSSPGPAAFVVGRDR
jgi:FAD/FMN-containing dehydrogenase